MKIAIVRGPNLNKFEMQSYEPLTKEYDITAYTTYKHNFDIDIINIPIKRVHHPEEFTHRLPFTLRLPINGAFYRIGYNSHMFGLEEELKNKDIAHVAETFNAYSYQAIRTKEKYGLKVIVSVWENIPFRQITSLTRFLDNNKLKDKVKQNADAFIAITERAKQALLLEGVQKEKIHVIPVGVDLDRFRPRRKNKALLSNLGLKEDDFVVLFIGRLTWAKGIYDLIYTAKMCLADSELKSIPIKFLLAGDGPEKNSIIREAERLQISETVRFMGSIPYHEIHLLYNLADIFTLPSRPARQWQEQFGMALVEAMASGNVIISTLSGSIPEVVGDAGILIQPNDPLSLYQEIKQLVLDKKLREVLRRKARGRAEEKFNCLKIADKIGGLYRSMGT